MIEMIIAGDELKNALAKIKSVKEGTYAFSNEELDYLNKFQAIDMSNQEWDDFSDIEYFKNLVTIYLQESIIHSFNGIKKIKSLKKARLNFKMCLSDITKTARIRCLRVSIYQSVPERR